MSPPAAAPTPAVRRGRASLRLTLILALVASPAWAQVRILPDAYQTPPRDARVVPLPKQARWPDAPFEFTPAARIVVGDAAAPEDLYAARELNEELAAWGASPLPVVRAADAGGATTGAVLIGEPSLNPLVAAALERSGLRVTAHDPGPEGYALTVAPWGVVAAGADRRGTFYAVQTLVQLIRRDGPRLVAAGAQIRDWPDHPIRAVHVVLDGDSDVFHTALIDRILARYKINMLIAEAEYVRWESAPSIWHPQGATTAQAAAVVAAARAHLIEPVPLIQTLGHAGWLFTNDQNLDLLEMPAELAPARFAYDPLNPRVYEVILPILDEAVALFRPRSLHIGHDEVRNVVPFPWSEEGRRLGFGELFVRDVLRLHAHLKAAGVGTMMWGDVLLTSDYVPEFARLPREITIVDWQYHAAARYPSLARFRAWGFPVLGATWYRHDNIAALSRAARDAGAAGMVRTTWTGYFGNRTALQGQFHQIAGYLPAAEHFWNAGRAGPAWTEVEAGARFRDDWEGARGISQTVPGLALDLRAAATRSHADEDGGGWLGKGPGYDLRTLPSGPVRLRGVRYVIIDPREPNGRSVVMLRGAREPLRDLPERATIGAGFRAGALCFLHALPYPAGRFGERVATYRVRFGDGGTAEIPVRYRLEIGTWLDDPTSISQEVAWTGATRAGVPVRLSSLCWANPDPQRPMVAIELASAGGETAPAIFAITALERPRGGAR